MHRFYIFNLRGLMTICWCTIYEDINTIVLHNSFINVLFNQVIWWDEAKNIKKNTTVDSFYLQLVLKGLKTLFTRHYFTCATVWTIKKKILKVVKKILLYEEMSHVISYLYELLVVVSYRWIRFYFDWSFFFVLTNYFPMIQHCSFIFSGIWKGNHGYSNLLSDKFCQFMAVNLQN